MIITIQLNIVINFTTKIDRGNLLLKVEDL
jgi:hypothetical protein